MKKLLCVWLALSPTLFGCGRSSNNKPTLVAKNKAGGEDLLKPAIDLLQQANRLSHFRDALQLINQHLTRPEVAPLTQLSSEQREFLAKEVQLDKEELEEISTASFRRLDEYYLDSCFLFRDAARMLEVSGLPRLEQARLGFEWVCRRIFLHEQADENIPGFMALRRGYGSPRDRAIAAIAILRQFQIEAVVLAPPGPPEEPFTPLLVGVPVFGEKGTDLYLFDPRLGLAVTGPEGKGIATFAQLKAKPELAKRLGLDAAEVEKYQAFIACSLSAMAPRMNYLESMLLAQDRVALYLDVLGLQKNLASKLGCEVKVWHSSSDRARIAYSPVRALRMFLPPEEGGIDKTDRFRRCMLHLIPWPHILHHYRQMNLLRDLPPPARQTLVDRTHDLFNTFFLQPEEFFLRGQFDACYKRIDRIATPLEQEEFVKQMSKEERQKHVNDFVARLQEAYKALEQKDGNAVGMLPKIWNEDLYLLVLLQVDGEAPPLNRVDKKALSMILLTACGEPLRQQVNYLNASLWHEKAARDQALVDFLEGAGKDATNVRAKALEAWRTAKSAWNAYSDRFRLRPESIPGKLKEIQKKWEQNELELAVGSFELLHQELHGGLEARLRLARVHKQLDDLAAAEVHWRGALDDLKAYEASDIHEELKRLHDKSRSLPQNHLSHRLTLLLRDWDKVGYLPSFRQTVQHHLMTLTPAKR